MCTNDLGPLVDQLHEKFKDDAAYQAECLYNDITARILDYMEEHDVSRADLARRMGVSEARVSSIFGQTQNFTLQTLAKMAAALGIELGIVVRQSEVPARRARSVSRAWTEAQGEAEQGGAFERLTSGHSWSPEKEKIADGNGALPTAA